VGQPDLWARIVGALRSEGVDADEFETAAALFLRDSFPTISPVSGGTDFGRDADILEGDDVVRLLVTTSPDPRANLRNGLRRMRQEGVPFHEVVLVGSQPVSATRRRQLEKIAADEFESRLVMVYDQKWLAGELYRDPIWRERLLGVTGEPPALTPLPLGLSHSHLPNVEYIGRNDALAHLRSGDSDLIVVAGSGMGKTRLVAELADSVFVELHGETARIADDIRRLEPSAVVVDDAHDHPASLDLLRRIRNEGPPPFRIIATTWPETVEAVRDQLPGADELVLEPLERTEGARILEALRITNRLLVGDILDQAEGRPGWILVLGDLARQEDVERVVTGAALIEQVGRFTRRLAQGPVALDLLARVTALGHVTDEELSPLADETGLAIAEVSEQLRRLARHGLAEWTQGRWRARPARLGVALVAHQFFSSPPAASIDILLHRWPQKTLAIVNSVVSAALVGSATADQAAQALLPALANEDDLLGDEAGELLRSYALVSPHTASWVIRYLTTRFPEGPPSAPPVDEDLLGQRDIYRERARWNRAAAAAEGVAQKFVLAESFDLLARMALQDDGPTNHSNHPRRRLLDLPTNVGPYWGTDRDLRREALHCAVRLADSDSRAAEELAAELASAAMSPRGRGSWLDPVDRRQFTWVEVLEDAEQLKWIADTLWPAWRNVIDGLSDTAVGKGLELARSWQRLAAEAGRLQASEEAKDIARRSAMHMLRDLRARCELSPGLATEWNARLEHLPESNDIEPIDVDPGFSALVPDLNLSWREREEARRQRTGQLAEEMHKLDPDQIAQRLDGWLRSAEAGGHPIGTSVGQLLEELGHRGRPTDLLLAVLARAELLRYGYALAATALEAEPDRWREWVPAGLDHPERRGLVAQVILSESSTPQDAIAHALNELNSADSWMLEAILTRRGIADSVVQSILTHSDPIISCVAALEFRVGSRQHGLDLPDGWYDEWRQAFLQVPSELSDHATWQFEEVAKALAASDPDLLTEWFLKALAPTAPRLDHRAIELLAGLPQQHRRRVLDAAAEHPARRWLVCAAIGHDAEFVPSLLDENVINVEDVLLCIERDRRGRWFETVAPELVRREARPRDVATHLIYGTGWGEESEVYTSLADYLSGLASSDSPELVEIGRAGEAAFREAAAEAAARERQDRIRGL
jgi:hypothetical protein